MPSPYRLAWVTDPHFLHADAAAMERFRGQIAATAPDALLITGDLATAPDLVGVLREIVVPLPVARKFIVLGNHDFYGSGIPQTRFEVTGQMHAHPDLVYLTRAGVVPLTPTVGLVGHDGWYDGRVGAYATSDVVINDFRCIDELARCVRRHDLLAMVRQLADQAVAELAPSLEAALQRFPQVLVATHVPPWPEASRYEHMPQDPEWAPWFVSMAMGEYLRDAARRHPDRKILVLCGHTHTAATFEAAPNLHCRVGRARYGHPLLEDVLEF